MKCGACKQGHASIAQVKACYSGENAFPEACRHGLPPMQCSMHRGRKANWSQRFHLRWPTKCFFCKQWMEEGDIGYKRYSLIAHGGCIEDPGAGLQDPTLYWLDGDALGIPDYESIPASLRDVVEPIDMALMRLATLIADETTTELIEDLALDMGEEIFLLVAEHMGGEALALDEVLGVVALTVGGNED